ncbi:MAG: MMPL family transporter [Bacteroidales bacterium]|nr:MMPL family transporter [Bacteroidales bacterium]
MTRLFLALYRFFKAHKAVFYIILTLSTITFGYFGTRIQFEENIASLLPKTEKSSDCDIAFGNIKVKDKIFIEAISRSGEAGPAELSAAMADFLELLSSRDGKGLVANIFSGIDTDDIMNIVYYGMEALPCHLDEKFYSIIDTLLNDDVAEAVAEGDLPFELPDLGSFSIIDGRLFSPDSTTALAFISPSFSSYDTWLGTDLEKMMSSCVSIFEKSNPDMEILYHGAIVEGTFNSHQIKKDLVWTLAISLLLICLIICFCFKSKSTLLHILFPIAYGTFFALSGVYWIQGHMSIMAIGIGALIMGVAMSYCLHVLTHQKFVSDVETVIKEQVRPVCLGCLTTIGAFAGLFFTTSSLLKDFGLFASLMLVGTTFFVLAFLPQFFGDGSVEKNEKAFDAINRFNSYPLDKNMPAVIIIAAVSVFCIFYSRNVGFDNDLNNIGYKEPKVVRSSKLYDEKINNGHYCQYYAAHSDNLDSAITFNRCLNQRLDSLKSAGTIYSFGSVDGILIPYDEQVRNIGLWENYWTPEKVSKAYGILKKQAAEHEWAQTGFDIPETFKLMTESEYSPQSIIDAGVLPESLLCNFVENNEDGWLVFSSVMLDKERLYEINDIITEQENVIVLDPFYYTGDMVEIAHRDFNLVLMFSSIFVFIVLLLSFRSLTIAVISFLPMFLSWYIVQGMMALFGIQFNLVNIMISTFIFGIGVDYSIFVMEGLINGRKSDSQRLLVCHKAAIFFSALILLIVVGSLIFATHPAIHSVGTSTIIGMTATILLTYAIEPLLFRLAMKNSFLRRKALHEK